MPTKFLEILSKLDSDERIQFYEILAHNLTVSIRGVWSDPDISDSEKVEGMKWINEILHRIISKISCLRKNTNKWTDEMSWQNIQHWASQNKNAAGHIGAALNITYGHFHKRKHANDLNNR